MKVFIEKSTTEEKIIQGCKKQKESAQKNLFDKYSGKMMGVCCRYIKDRLEAEGVMVNGFVKIFEKIDQYTGEGNFEGWMRRIMVNESLMYIRKNKNMSLHIDIDEARQIEDLNFADNDIQENDLLKIINELPVGYRTVFNLYAIEGYSHKEIADQLDISENTSKSQLSRARGLLQSHLADLEKQINMSHGIQ